MAQAMQVQVQVVILSKVCALRYRAPVVLLEQYARARTRLKNQVGGA